MLIWANLDLKPQNLQIWLCILDMLVSSSFIYKKMFSSFKKYYQLYIIVLLFVDAQYTLKRITEKK